MYDSVAEGIATTALFFLTLTIFPLGVALLFLRLSKNRATAAQRAALLHIALTATIAALGLALVRLPRPVVPVAAAPPAAPVLVNGRPPLPAGLTIEKTPPPPLKKDVTYYLSYVQYPFFVGVALVWVTGISILAARLFVGIVGVLRLRRGAGFPPDSEVMRICREAFDDVRRQPRIITTARPGGDVFLMDLPFLPPAVALPQDAGTRFNADDLRAILAHERAHLQRQDGHWNLLAQALCCLVWFQPFLWLTARALERESEAACDEAALAAAETPRRAYADLLLRVAASHLSLGPSGTSRVGVVPLVIPSRLEERLRSLMNRSPLPASPRRRLVALASVSLLTAAGAFAFGPKSNDLLQPVPLPTPPPVKGVNLNVDNVSAREVVEMALTQTGTRLAPGDMERYFSDDKRTMSMAITGVPIEDFLRTPLRSNVQPSTEKVWMRIERTGDVVGVIPVPLAPDGLPTTHVTADYPSGTLGRALWTLLQGTDFQVQMHEDVPLRAAVSERDVPVNEAIARLMRQYPEQVVHVYENRVDVRSRQSIEETRQRVEASLQESLNAPVNVDVTAQPLQEAVNDLLYRGRVSNYMVQPYLAGDITLRLHRVPLRDALTAMLKQSKTPATFTTKDGQLIITSPSAPALTPIPSPSEGRGGIATIVSSRLGK